MATVKFICVLVAVLALFVELYSAVDPTPVKARKLLLKRKGGDSTHWCCKDVDLTPKVVHTTRPEAQRYITHEKHTYVSGYEPCDKGYNVTWSYCKVYKTDIINVPKYRLVQVDLVHTETPACPEKSLICCKGYSLFMGNCYRPDKLEAVKKLVDSGLVG